MKVKKRKALIDRAHALPVIKQCQLVDVSRSSIYYRPVLISDEDDMLMRLIDEIHLKRPFLGSRRIRDELIDLGHPVNRKKVRRLMHKMGIIALYPKPVTSLPGFLNRIRLSKIERSEIETGTIQSFFGLFFFCFFLCFSLFQQKLVNLAILKTLKFSSAFKMRFDKSRFPDMIINKEYLNISNR